MSALGKNISANLLSNVWSTGLLILLTPVYVHFLGVESYGLIGLYQSWVAILSILDTGISTTAGREVAWLIARSDGQSSVPTLIRTLEIVYWGIVGALGILLLLAAWAFGAEWVRTTAISPEIVKTAMMLMAIALVAQTPSGLYVAGLMGLQRQAECSGLVAFFATVRGVGGIVVLWKIVPDIRAFFAWQIMVSGIQTAVIRWTLWKRVRLPSQRAKFSSSMLRSVRAFAGSVVVISILGVLTAQVDKVILSRVIPLEQFGLYMLAWAVASGLARIANPLIQAFAPRFTELVSAGHLEQLTATTHLASQLMSALILPPAALVVFLARPILGAWTNDAGLATRASLLLSVMIVGTALSACSYPVLTIFYSKKNLRPVIAVSIASLVLVIPALLFLVRAYGVLGASISWALYGTAVFIAFEILGLRELAEARVLESVVRDFLLPAAAAISVAAVARHFIAAVPDRRVFVALLGVSVIVSWGCALLACPDLIRYALWRRRSGGSTSSGVFQQ